MILKTSYMKKHSKSLNKAFIQINTDRQITQLSPLSHRIKQILPLSLIKFSMKHEKITIKEQQQSNLIYQFFFRLLFSKVENKLPSKSFISFRFFTSFLFYFSCVENECEKYWGFLFYLFERSIQFMLIFPVFIGVELTAFVGFGIWFVGWSLKFAMWGNWSVFIHPFLIFRYVWTTNLLV